MIDSLVLGCKRPPISGSLQVGVGRGATNDEAIESMAFEVCDIDSDSGLTWEEVEACEVS